MSTIDEDGINEELVDSESYSPLYKRGLEEKTLDLLASEVYLLVSEFPSFITGWIFLMSVIRNNGQMYQKTKLRNNTIV